MSEHMIELNAAIAGQGVALGWAHLVDPLIEQGLLVPLGTRHLRTPWSVYLIWLNRPRLSADAEVVNRWMLEAASARGTSQPAP